MEWGKISPFNEVIRKSFQDYLAEDAETFRLRYEIQIFQKCHPHESHDITHLFRIEGKASCIPIDVWALGAAHNVSFNNVFLKPLVTVKYVISKALSAMDILKIVLFGILKISVAANNLLTAYLGLSSVLISHHASSFLSRSGLFGTVFVQCSSERGADFHCLVNSIELCLQSRRYQ